MKSAPRFLAPVLISTIGIFGCSLVNSFDEVADLPSASAGAGGQVAQAGQAGSGTGGSATAGTGGVLAGGAAGSLGVGGLAGSGGQGGSIEPPPPGLIVMGGYDADSPGATGNDKQQILSVLSPQTGQELKREDGNFVGMLHDGFRDIWFLVKNRTSKQNPPALKDILVLEARKFDRATNEWQLLTNQPLEIPNPDDPTLGLVLLRNRLAFKTTHDPANDTELTEPELVVIDISDPAIPKFAPGSPKPVGSGVLTLIGNTPTGVLTGGTLTIVKRTCNEPNVCDVGLARATVTAATVQVFPPDPISQKVPPSSSIAGIANFRDTLDILVFPPPGNNIAQLAQFSPNDHKQIDIGKLITFQLANAFPRVAFDPCARTAFVATLIGNSRLWAIPVSGATIGFADFTEPVHSMFYEPFTKTVFTVFQNDIKQAIVAFSAEGSPDAPKLVKREFNWAPPADLHPKAAGVAMPRALNCQ